MPEEIEVNVGSIKVVEIKTMAEMTEQEYIDFVKSDSYLFLVDHHGVLRCAQTGMPFATSPRQVDLLIEYLQYERSKVGEAVRVNDFETPGDGNLV